MNASQDGSKYAWISDSDKFFRDSLITFQTVTTVYVNQKDPVDFLADITSKSGLQNITPESSKGKCNVLSDIHPVGLNGTYVGLL